MAAKPAWATIRFEYEFTGLSVKRLAARHGLAESTIKVRVSREGWQRRITDTAPVPDGLAKETMRAARVAARQLDQIEGEVDAIVAENALLQAGMLAQRHFDETRESVNNAHSAALASLRHLTGGLTLQLAETAAELTQVGDQWQRMGVISEAAKTNTKLVAALEKLITLERQAHGIRAPGEGDNDLTFEDFIMMDVDNEGADVVRTGRQVARRG